MPASQGFGASETISHGALKDQIKFMQDRLTQNAQELTAKDLTIQSIEIEKRETLRKYESLDLANYELEEKLSGAESRCAMLEAENASLKQQLSQQASQLCSKGPKRGQLNTT